MKKKSICSPENENYTTTSPLQPRKAQTRCRHNTGCDDHLVTAAGTIAHATTSQPRLPTHQPPPPPRERGRHQATAAPATSSTAAPGLRRARHHCARHNLAATNNPLPPPPPPPTEHFAAGRLLHISRRRRLASPAAASPPTEHLAAASNGSAAAGGYGSADAASSHKASRRRRKQLADAAAISHEASRRRLPRIPPPPAEQLQADEASRRRRLLSRIGSDRMGRGYLLAADLVEDPISLPWTLLREKTKLPFHHSKYSGTTSWANLYLEVPQIFHHPIELIGWLRFHTGQYRWYLLDGSFSHEYLRSDVCSASEDQEDVRSVALLLGVGSGTML
uniref:Uncharacterized protein n=1 Tax=Oryza sativa subsp. japonica TaxID=39947 RepID=Q6ER27_ORYSJ|nr:hypothetical protein [Oryza sativa Japonica Group]